ncbi:tetratricopeptide repeat protein [Streptomyces sp. NBC_01768]|uniref:tetratricopeptide repeat protein n=1 Tax=Streptomyces sp. NBC_01768 TaxID=2975938 RepID=UPI002DDAB5B9|nr:tetratricopeptide repeat protein [Streptomyces sp. NBC_01768]WSC32168.1 tetratricopeptide repeat protein [Streptomyces sp. NBC_01768]
MADGTASAPSRVSTGGAPLTPRQGRQRPAKQPNPQLQQAAERSGLSYGQIARDLNELASRRGYVLATDRGRVAHWVLDGEQPKAPVPDLLAELFTAYFELGRPLAPEELGFRSTRSVSGSGITPDVVRSYTRSARASDVQLGDVEDLELYVAQLSGTYSAHAPRELWEQAASVRARAAALLTQRRHTLREGRDLSHHAGMLSVVLAWIAHDLGEGEFVDAYCSDAWEQGQQAGALEIGAWAEDVRCTDALYDGRDLDALAAATRGLAVAPQGSRVALRLRTQLARVYAKMGQEGQFEEVMRRVRQDSERLPLHKAGLFSLDAAVVTSYAASSLVWLGRHDAARDSALEAIERYQEMPMSLGAPTRLAIARLDLALACASLGDPEAAISMAMAALAEGRSVQSVRSRARHVHYRLSLRYPAADGLPDLQKALDNLSAQ